MEKNWMSYWRFTLIIIDIVNKNSSSLKILVESTSSATWHGGKSTCLLGCKCQPLWDTLSWVSFIRHFFLGVLYLSICHTAGCSPSVTFTDILNLSRLWVFFICHVYGCLFRSEIRSMIIYLWNTLSERLFDFFCHKKLFTSPKKCYSNFRIDVGRPAWSVMFVEDIERQLVIKTNILCNGGKKSLRQIILLSSITPTHLNIWMEMIYCKFHSNYLSFVLDRDSSSIVVGIN